MTSGLSIIHYYSRDLNFISGSGTGLKTESGGSQDTKSAHQPLVRRE